MFINKLGILGSCQVGVERSFDETHGVPRCEVFWRDLLTDVV